MIIVTVMYDPEDSNEFDMGYYKNTHMPLVRDRLGSFGLQKYEVAKGISDTNPAEPPLYNIITQLYFDNVDNVHEGFKQHGREVLGDISNFTSVKPKFQISEVEDLWLMDGYVHTHSH